MVNQRFRSIYLAALIVVCVGLLGTILVPKAHAGVWKKPEVIQQRMATSSKSLFEFASFGLLSSVGLALLYSKSKA